MDERVDSLYVVLKVHEMYSSQYSMAQWLSWLERRPVTAEVESSSLFWVVMWGLSSAGRASALQAEGHRFEPCNFHHKKADAHASALFVPAKAEATAPDAKKRDTARCLFFLCPQSVGR